MGQRKYGYVLIILSAMFYASMGFVGKFIYAEGVSAYQVTFIRFLLSAVILCAVLGFMRAKPFIALKPLVFLQALANIACGLCFFFSLSYLPAGLMIAIFFTYPVFVSLFAFIFYRERMHWMQVLGIFLALAGLLLVAGLFEPATVQASPFGLLLAIGSSITFALYTIIGQKTLQTFQPLTILFTIFAIGAVVVFLINPVESVGFFSLLSWKVVGLTVALSVFCTILCMQLFLIGMKMIGATAASIISIVEIPLALMFAFVLLGERLSVWQIIGSILIIAASFLAAWGGSRLKAAEENAAEELEAAEEQSSPS